MPIKKAPTPPSCDYEPILGDVDDISFGIVEAAGNPPRTLADVIARRWCPTERPLDFKRAWPETTARVTAVLLTKGAPEHFTSVRHLCEAYHSKPGNRILHLAAQITIRFPRVDAVPQQMGLHEAQEQARGSAYRLATRLQAAAIFCMHVPATS